MVSISGSSAVDYMDNSPLLGLNYVLILMVKTKTNRVQNLESLAAGMPVVIFNRDHD